MWITNGGSFDFDTSSRIPDPLTPDQLQRLEQAISNAGDLAEDTGISEPQTHSETISEPPID